MYVEHNIDATSATISARKFTLFSSFDEIKQEKEGLKK